jgi:glyoxylase-like metal-dependent hydrolase (beta-lactamase superfamily II)
MKRPAKGRIHERITAVPNAWYPAYIVQGEKHNLMIDPGMNLLGPRYLASIKDVLGDPGRLDYLFLTHSHYDHLGAAYYLKRHLPGLKIGAHEMLAGLLQKPSVLEVMNRLSDNHVELLQYNTAHEDLTVRPFEIDIALHGGDEFDLGGLTCRVYATPGHTRDSLAFHLPEIGALFPAEACGLLESDTGSTLLVEFLSSYQDYIDSLRLIIALEPEIVCLGHGWVLTGEDAPAFLQRSFAETFRYRELIESYLDAADDDVEQAIRDMAHVEYDVKVRIHQEREAYVTNLAAQVRHIAGLR